MYQLKIWYSSIEAKPQLEDAECCGWTLENDCWNPIFSVQEPIPEIVRQCLSLYCSDKNCNNKKCNCVKEGLKCCEQCKCVVCNNCVEYMDEFKNDEGFC